MPNNKLKAAKKKKSRNFSQVTSCKETAKKTLIIEKHL